MPTALVLKGPRELAFEQTPEVALAPSEVRIRTLFSGISAGTELSQYRGTNPFMNRRWDEHARLFRAGAFGRPPSACSTKEASRSSR